MNGLQCRSKNNVLMQEQINPLLCNPESGICEIPGKNTISSEHNVEISENKPVKIIYFTDPICSSCWGIEPQLRKLKSEYGHLIEIEYRMGGLLPDWSYNSGGISKPSDVTHHWDEVSLHYDMPIDGDVWLEDPLTSSYPPSIACKAAQLQDDSKAVLFLREIREMVFLQKKNITKMEHLQKAAEKVGLDVNKFKKDYEGEAKNLFLEDLELAKKSGVRGFPTIFMSNKAGSTEVVYGSKPYTIFENVLLKLYPESTKTNYEKTWSYIFSKYHTLTAKEYSELSGTDRKKSEILLDELVSSGKLEKYATKNGAIWKLKNPDSDH
jgi:predicted DsbA family dithiol-disulfide isomerase